MDMRHLQVPRIEQPRLRATGDDFINAMNAQLAWINRQKKAEEAVRIHYGGAFGVMRAIRISPEGTDFLRIFARDESGTAHQIIAPVSQCSFMFSLFVPSEKEPEEKVILGFAEGQQT